MFDNLKGMAGLAGLMKDLPRIKAQMEEVKARLETMTVDAETGGGAVRATANGHLRIVNLHIDHALMGSLIDPARPEDMDLATDLITGAINGALERARELAERELGAAAQDLGLPIPPGGIEGLLGG